MSPDGAVNRLVLTEEAALLRSILDTAAEGIITIDASGVMQSVNPAATRMFGFEERELLGSNVSKLMPEPYRSNHAQYLHHYLDTGEARIIGRGREVEGQRKDGTVFPMGLAVSEVNLPNQRLFTGIVRDLSARREAEEQARIRLNELAHASRLLELGEMTSTLTHEVSQPLTAVVSFAQACSRMLKAGTADPTVLEDTLERIVQQGERAAQILNGLRSFARKHSDERLAVAPRAIIDGVLSLLSHDIRRGGVQVHVQVDQCQGEMIVNPVQIEQVLVNLIRNAAEAMDSVPRGQRHLFVSATGNSTHGYVITVRDTGGGLPEEDLQRLFDPFFTTKSEGMGVGLSVSNTIAKAHGGRLSASNGAEGGAEFILELPAKP